jgi:hypothetical protein
MAWAVALGVSLGAAFATKIVAFASIAVIALPALLLAPRAVHRRVFFLLAGATAIGLLFAYALDPALWHAPIRETLDRFHWRRDRIAVQQIVFVADRLSSVPARLRFAARSLYADGPIALACFALTLATVFSWRSQPGGDETAHPRARWLAGILAVTYAALMLYTLPMAWVRYVAAALPFFVLIAAASVDDVLKLLRTRRVMRPRGIAFVVGVTMATTALGFALEKPRSYLPPPITNEQRALARDYARSLMEPGADPALHRRLEAWFRASGDAREAARQRALGAGQSVE